MMWNKRNLVNVYNYSLIFFVGFDKIKNNFYERGGGGL